MGGVQGKKCLLVFPPRVFSLNYVVLRMHFQAVSISYFVLESPTTISCMRAERRASARCYAQRA